jgi:acyl-coenzyme A thioesterase PaaI-like protein
LGKEQSVLDLEANRCFVCGQGNESGLKLTFRLEDDVCRSEFIPLPQHAGYDNVTHGGIIFSVLDDVMANWLWLKRVKCFTARADIRYRSHLPVGCAVHLEGRMIKRKGRLALMEGLMMRQDTNETVARASGSFMVAD